jgi:hypothetical protein
VKLKLNWDQLRPIQNNKIVNSLYIWLVIVPVAAKLLSKIENELTITLGNQDIVLDMRLPFSWELFFFSALCFVVGNILYLMFCPAIIKDHTNYGNFKEVGGTDAHLSDYRDQILKFRADLISQLKKSAGIEQGKLSEHEKNEETKNLFWGIYNYFNETRVLAKFLVAVFYLVGLILFLIVAITNVTWIIRQIVGF